MLCRWATVRLYSELPVWMLMARRNPQLPIAKQARRSLLAKHPWLYAGNVPMPSQPKAGMLVDLVDDSARLAVAYLDPESPIVARALAFEPDTTIDDVWVASRLRDAFVVRRRLELPTNAYRLLHGENDYLPGWVIDNYGGHWVMAFDGIGAETLWRNYIEVAIQVACEVGVEVHGVWHKPRRGPGACLWGRAPKGQLAVREHGAALLVDLRHGQKTGLFLDQRDSRAHVRRLSDHASVLNLFGYTGGFSVQAALGGARRTITVDQSQPALALAEATFHRNEAFGDHHFVCDDVFAYLESRKEKHDIVICDPPSFAKSAKTLERARRAYIAVNDKALRVVKPGGVLVTASCSSHFRELDLCDALGRAGQGAQRQVRIVTRMGAGGDHPTRPGFPEGRYLNVLIAHVI